MIVTRLMSSGGDAHLQEAAKALPRWNGLGHDIDSERAVDEVMDGLVSGVTTSGQFITPGSAPHILICAVVLV